MKLRERLMAGHKLEDAATAEVLVDAAVALTAEIAWIGRQRKAGTLATEDAGRLSALTSNLRRTLTQLGLDAPKKRERRKFGVPK